MTKPAVSRQKVNGKSITEYSRMLPHTYYKWCAAALITAIEVDTNPGTLDLVKEFLNSTRTDRSETKPDQTGDWSRRGYINSYYHALAKAKWQWFHCFTNRSEYEELAQRCVNLVQELSPGHDLVSLWFGFEHPGDWSKRGYINRYLRSWELAGFQFPSSNGLDSCDLFWTVFGMDLEIFELDSSV